MRHSTTHHGLSNVAIGYLTALLFALASAGAYAAVSPGSGGWAYSHELAVDADQVDGDHVDFPVLVRAAVLPPALLDADGGSAARSDGGDIRFTRDAAGQVLLIHLEKTE